MRKMILFVQNLFDNILLGYELMPSGLYFLFRFHENGYQIPILPDLSKSGLGSVHWKRVEFKYKIIEWFKQCHGWRHFL